MGNICMYTPAYTYVWTCACVNVYRVFINILITSYIIVHAHTHAHTHTEFSHLKIHAYVYLLHIKESNKLS